MAILFRDDFDGSSLNTTTNWTVSSGPTYVTVSGGLCTLSGHTSSGPSFALKTPPTLSKGCYIQCRVQWYYTTQSTYNIGFTINGVSYGFTYAWEGTSDTYLKYRENTTITNIGTGYGSAQHIYRVEYTTDDKILFYIDGSLTRTKTGIASGTISINTPTYCYDSGTSHIIDYVEIGNLLPTVTTQAVSSIASTTATGNGNVTSDGGATITERGTCISTSANPTTADTKDTAAGTTGAYTTSIDSLSPATLYHVRAYAINSVGTSYGADVEFTTLSVAPTVTTQAVSSIAQTTATGNGNITATGGINAYQRGVATVAGASGDITFLPLIDPSFEGATNTWGATTSTDQAKYGSKSAKLTYVSGSEAGYDYGWDNASLATLMSGKRVTFYCWVWSAVAGIACLDIYDNDGSGFNNDRSSYHTGNSTWQLLSVTHTFRASLTTALFRLHWSGTSAGSAYFDGPIIAISPNTSYPVLNFQSGDIGTGAFTEAIGGLTANTAYRTTAFATNPIGTGYGATSTFTTDDDNSKILVVAGGGSGGGSQGTSIASGGGGAGGLIYNANYTLTPQTYTVTVGNGGTGVAGFNAGGQGQNSVFDSQTAVGGGYGGTWTIAPTVGGSGGGAGENGQGLDGAAGTAGQGYAGGNDNGYDSGAPSAGGGGGGSGGAGSDSVSNIYGGAGGVGLSCSISATARFYAGGGGGAGSTTAGAGGNGGGGTGRGVTTGAGTAGTANTGGGGGGSLTNVNEAVQAGGNGGSGIVIVKWKTSNFATCSVTGTGNTLDTTTIAGTSIATFIVSGNLSIVGLPPAVTTQAVSSITATTATGNGNITVAGSINSYQRGIATVPASSGDITFIALTNPSFESWTAGITSPPDGWYCPFGTTNAAARSTDKYYGTYGAQFTSGSSGDPRMGRYVMSLIQNATYTISLWVKHVSGAGTGFYFAFNDTNNTNGITLTSSWALYNFTVKYTGASGSYFIDFGTSTYNDVVLIDGMTMAISPNDTPATLTFDSGNYGTGAFTTSLTGLTDNTIYTATAFATNSGGTSYGNSVLFAHGIKTGLISYWKTDESSGNADDSVSSNDGVNTSVTYSTGKINNGAVFNGSTSNLNIGTSTLFSKPNSLTVSAWIYPTSLSSRYAVFSTRGANSAGCFQLEVGVGNAKTDVVCVTTPGVFTIETNNNAVVLNSWNHIVYTRDGVGNTHNVYVNGTLKGLQTFSSVDFINNSDTKNIGIGTSTTLNPFSGTIDEIGLWGRALTQDEVNLLYNSGNGVQYPFEDLNISIVDSLNLSENITSTLQLGDINSFDTLNFSENITSNTELGYINIYDPINISENYTDVLLGDINIYDSFDISEEVTIENPSLGDISIIDNLDIYSSDAILDLIIESSVTDSITISENFNRMSELSVLIYENIDITDQNLTEILNNITIYDSVTITGNITIDSFRFTGGRSPLGGKRRSM